MSERKHPVRFLPSGRITQAAEGALLVEAATQAGIVLDLPCGGEGICGKCRVVLEQPAAQPNAAEINVLSDEELDRGVRLACQQTVTGPITVEVPETSLLATYHQILARGQTATPQVADDPPVRKRYLELPPPARGDEAADLARLQRATGPCVVDLELLRLLPAKLRQARFRGTAVMVDGTLIDFEPGDTRAETYSVAIDVGTTTLVAMLINAVSGEELALTCQLNPQTRYGDDVLARIQLAGSSEEGFRHLHKAIIAALNTMIRRLAASAGIQRKRIYEVCLAGNTTMQHLVCGINPQYLGEVPFAPSVSQELWLAAAQLGLHLHPRARAYVLPAIGGFVGGDIVAGMLATRIDQREDPAVLVDIGTNGEIVLAAGGKLSAAATAAGPAFEGARITHGMRAASGAIERVVVDAQGKLTLAVIGGARPAGLCGSALIDVAAELLRHGLLSPEGRIASADRLPDQLPRPLAGRLTSANGHDSFLLARPEETAIDGPILLSQRDLRQLQLASGAIRAGIVILLRRAGLEPQALGEVDIAGGFGNYVRRRNAQRIGLIPQSVPEQRIRYQGNTSLAGARLVALSTKARRTAERLARQTEHVDLSTDHGFQWAFADAMIFPSSGD